MSYSRARPDWVDFPNTTTLVRAQDYDQWDQGIYDLKTGSRKYLIDYGTGVGQGSATADTAAFRAAASDAISNTLVLPPSLLLNDTITFVPLDGTNQYQMNIEGTGKYSQILWAGGDNKSIFKTYGWKRSQISGVQVRIPSSNTGVVVWDVDHDSTHGSTGVLNWVGCHVTPQSSSGTVAWRMGHTSGTELSFINWYGCTVDADTLNGPTIGWVNEDPNGLILNFWGCAATNTSYGWSNTSTSGAASVQGGPSMHFYGCGGTSNAMDFDFKNAGVYLISGGRWELGQRFLNVPSASTASFVYIDSAEIASYSPTDNQVFRFDKPGTLYLNNLHVKPSSGTFTSDMIRMDTTVSQQASLWVVGGGYVAADPFYKAAGLTQPLAYIKGVKVLNAAGQTTGIFTDTDPFTGQYLSGAGKTTVVDGDFVAPQNGMIATHYDTTAGKAYISTRANGSWKVMAGPV